VALATTAALILFATTLPAQEHAASPQAEHAAAEHADEHHDSTTAWKWANFAILAAALGYGISKAAGPFFAGRTNQIQHSLLEAKKLREDAETRAAEIDRRMANLGAEIESLRADARRELTAESERISAETARLLAKVEEHARQEIDSTLKHATQQLQAHAAALAVDLAAGKIQSRMTPAVEQSLVDSFVTRMARPNPN
jgi:F0F1-type ATP synthase membrane subunit b/b'